MKVKQTYVRLDKQDDEALLESVQQGNSQALDLIIEKYSSFVRTKAYTYFLVGADREDIVQEGMIGLYKAIRDYDKDKLSSFKGFAELCVTRQIITAIKTATRQKHIPLNSYVSLDKPLHDDDSERTMLDVVGISTETDPQEMLINQEELGSVEGRLSDLLSELEKQVLHLYLDGCSYQEISKQLKRHEKSIDNALQRVKKKLEQVIMIDEPVLK